MSVLDRVRFLGVLFALALVLVVVWRFPILAALIGWAALVYVLIRAFPAIRADVRALYTRYFPPNSWRF